MHHVDRTFIFANFVPGIGADGKDRGVKVAEVGADPAFVLFPDIAVRQKEVDEGCLVVCGDIIEHDDGPLALQHALVGRGAEEAVGPLQVGLI